MVVFWRSGSAHDASPNLTKSFKRQVAVKHVPASWPSFPRKWESMSL